ncbi:MAG TPA: VanZ family protein [Terracidiphilus sp.]|nr:VanZ family protein [Terracidiphilus sp.]
MSSNRRNAKFWLTVWWPVALSAAVVAASSSSWMGSDHTSGPLRWLWQMVFGPVPDARWDTIHFIVRKTGHFTGYGLIGLAWLRAWWLTLPRSRYTLNAVLAVLGSALLASCDEFHQSFLPNRTGSPWDVLLDCCGATAMCLLVPVCARLLRREGLQRAA